MQTKEFLASDSELQNVIAFVEEELERLECSMKIVMQITVCVEEMFVNVAHYAYVDNKGSVKVALDYNEGAFSITLEDSGIEFNPLEKKDPDITLSAEDRDIGGLGIFMVKKTMDEVSYKRDNNKNIFYMKKIIN